eukprot:COSAG04_NODE_13080_length_621_cov_0.777778_1_plen_119_part_00
MLDYRGGSADVLDGNVVNEHVRWYAGTADDFKLFRVVLPASASTELPASPGPQIVLGIKGARAAPRHLALTAAAHGYSGSPTDACELRSGDDEWRDGCGGGERAVRAGGAGIEICCRA